MLSVDLAQLDANARAFLTSLSAAALGPGQKLSDIHNPDLVQNSTGSALRSLDGSAGDSHGLAPKEASRREPSSSGGSERTKPAGGNAQKRFRERQREKMSSLEAEVAEKKAAFDALSLENERLRARTSILEKVVLCRDEQLRMLTSFADQYTPHPSSCFSSSSSAPAPSNLSATSDPSFLGSSSTLLNHNACAATQEAIRALRKEHLIPQYKAFLAEVSSHLLHCQHPCSDPMSPIVQRVTQCVERMGTLVKQVVLINPKLLRQLLSVNLETLQPAAAPEGHWAAVVDSLQLTAEQRADIGAVFELYRGALEKVYEERRLIMELLGDGPHTLEPSSTTFTQRNALASEMELTERLNGNLGKEESAQTLLCCFCFGKVLAATQFAKLAVYSWPYFPDSLALATAVVRQAGAGAAGGGMAEGGRGSGSEGCFSGGGGAQHPHYQQLQQQQQQPSQLHHQHLQQHSHGRNHGQGAHGGGGGGGTGLGTRGAAPQRRGR